MNSDIRQIRNTKITSSTKPNNIRYLEIRPVGGEIVQDIVDVAQGLLDGLVPGGRTGRGPHVDKHRGEGGDDNHAGGATGNLFQGLREQRVTISRANDITLEPGVEA